MARCWFPAIAVAVVAAVAIGAPVDPTLADTLVVVAATGVLCLVARRERGRPDLAPAPVAEPVARPAAGEVLVYEVSGPLYLGAAQRAMAALNHIGHPARAVVLLLDAVDSLDASGLVALDSALDEVERHPALAVLAGVRAQPLAAMRDAELLRRRGVVLCRDREKALRLVAARGPRQTTPEDALMRPANQPA